MQVTVSGCAVYSIALSLTQINYSIGGPAYDTILWPVFTPSIQSPCANTYIITSEADKTFASLT